ncbi:hypothetical protein [Arcicella rigui]|uniref:Uncharacterized protein n=1 Tax=Arcicella rigui TaxID=797020 RepID=A0ABU5QE66_9BACT|nr:hypothetical protein [Arcicella rigui]MEA5141140.1 hypothetical protein [Arcicella rigui]
MAQINGSITNLPLSYFCAILPLKWVSRSSIEDYAPVRSAFAASGENPATWENQKLP